MDIVRLFSKACDEFEGRLKQVKAGDWAKPTPCSQWSVKQLANHLAGEVLWVPELFAGKTIAEVGDKFDGDVLGSDALSVWRSASTAAKLILGEPGVLERTVHLSFGDFPGRGYAGQLLIDIVIHTWDLAQGMGRLQQIDPVLAAAAYQELLPQAEQWREGGAFAAIVDSDPSASIQTKLLALAGRKGQY